MGAVLVAGCAGDRREDEERSGAARYSVQAAPESAAPAERQVFDRETEVLATGAARLTVRAIVRADQGRAAARAALVRLVEDERRREPEVAAVRVVAYLPPEPGLGREVPLLPLAYAEWVPLTGWDSLRASSQGELHRLNTVFLVAVPEAAPAPSAPPAPLAGPEPRAPLPGGAGRGAARPR
jgi:hypothetical protein